MREARKLTQEELARRFGFKDRQTISAIETGERRLSAEELVEAARIFGTTIDELTDPFLLVGDEGRFSWRQSGVGPERLLAFERDAGRWVATFRRIAPQVGQQAPLLRRSLPLSARSTFEEAMAAGERFAADFALGDVPARRLISAMEQDLGILVLMVDAIDGVSGAACRLPELDVVLINRHEPEGRRHFDLAHELFHLLTWQEMPPQHSEESSENPKSHVERLANKFASAVLMPQPVVVRFGDWAGMDVGAITTKLNSTADALAVTASALKWRLVSLGIIHQAIARQISDAAIRNNGHTGVPREAPPPFSKQFMGVVARALDEGLLSTRRAANLLGVTLDDLPDLYQAHGIDATMEL
jgi:Zn-dependent peptidase ImmA (M78 family)/DNA-binding XRE family transcriptional regulator